MQSLRANSYWVPALCACISTQKRAALCALCAALCAAKNEHVHFLVSSAMLAYRIWYMVYGIWYKYIQTHTNVCKCNQKSA